MEVDELSFLRLMADSKISRQIKNHCKLSLRKISPYTNDGYFGKRGIPGRVVAAAVADEFSAVANKVVTAKKALVIPDQDP